MTIIVYIAALLPIVLLLWYIYKRDKWQPEPIGQMLKAFFLGITSVILSLFISIPSGAIGLYPAEATSIAGAISVAFFGAAIPEELAKFFILWLFLRKNRHFNEKMDGIVYAVCVSLGFAALENIMYLTSNYEEWLVTGISRALFAVPGHFCFGILMGYYYSLAKFYPCKRQSHWTLALAAPILAHGAYDSILFICNVSPEISTLLIIAFLFFCHKLWKYGSKKIDEHLERDRQVQVINICAPGLQDKVDEKEDSLAHKETSFN